MLISLLSCDLTTIDMETLAEKILVMKAEQVYETVVFQGDWVGLPRPATGSRTGPPDPVSLHFGGCGTRDRSGAGSTPGPGEEVEVDSGENELEDTPTSPVTNVPNETTNSTEQNSGRPPLIPPTREKVKYQRPKTSVVWQFMTLDKENSIAICNK
ncbi:hypothetical protein H5410_040604, partial [Solanum commersonii]